MMEMIDNVDHNSMDNVLADDVVQQRQSRKDKERRPSDQVKNLLDHMAPEQDDSDSSDDEVERRIKAIEYEKRKSLKMKKRQSNVEQLNSMLDHLAPSVGGSDDEDGNKEN